MLRDTIESCDCISDDTILTLAWSDGGFYLSKETIRINSDESSALRTVLWEGRKWMTSPEQRSQAGLGMGLVTSGETPREVDFLRARKQISRGSGMTAQ